MEKPKQKKKRNLFVPEPTSVKRLIIHFENSEDIKAFGELIDQPDVSERTTDIWFPRK